MSAVPGQFDLQSSVVVMEPDQSMIPVQITSTLFEDLADRFEGFRGRWLISCLSFDSDWPVRCTPQATSSSA